MCAWQGENREISRICQLMHVMSRRCVFVMSGKGIPLPRHVAHGLYEKKRPSLTRSTCLLTNVRLMRQDLGMPAGEESAAVAAEAYWPDRLLRALARLMPIDVLWYVDTNTPSFALTFDDGPDPDVTPLLLDALAKHRARATFFVTGERVLGNEPIVARIAAEGHELGNHLMHEEPSVLLPDLEFRRQLRQVNLLLAPYGEVAWFRPGSGWVTPRMLRSAAQLNLRCVLGTVAAEHTGGHADQHIARRLVRRIRPGSIAVLHEGRSHRLGVVATTDWILAELGRRGLTSIPVSELATLT